MGGILVRMRGGGAGHVRLRRQAVQLQQTAKALAAHRPYFTAQVFGQQYTPDY